VERNLLAKKVIALLVSIPLLLPLLLMTFWPALLYGSLRLWVAHESAATWKDHYHASILTFYPVTTLLGFHFCARGVNKGLPSQSALGVAISYIPFVCLVILRLI